MEREAYGKEAEVIEVLLKVVVIYDELVELEDVRPARWQTRYSPNCMNDLESVLLATIFEQIVYNPANVTGCAHSP